MSEPTSKRPFRMGMRGLRDINQPWSPYVVPRNESPKDGPDPTELLSFAQNDEKTPSPDDMAGSPASQAPPLAFTPPVKHASCALEDEFRHYEEIKSTQQVVQSQSPQVMDTSKEEQEADEWITTKQDKTDKAARPKMHWSKEEQEADEWNKDLPPMRPTKRSEKAKKRPNTDRPFLPVLHYKGFVHGRLVSEWVNSYDFCDKRVI